MVFIESVLYLQLPVDLLPDAIPLLGQLDNAAARLIALIGLALLGCAVAFDTHLRWYSSAPEPNLSAPREPREESELEPALEPVDRAELKQAGEMSYGYLLWPFGTFAVVLGACMIVPVFSQLANNLLGLATGRLKIVSVGGQRAIITT